jgi:hypothetical protein
VKKIGGQFVYLYENLSPERLQQFCQALLLDEFPGLRCFPVGQPDGGRDALLAVRHHGRDQQFAVFQVKFNRNALTRPDQHKWLDQILSEEAPKINRLIPRGAHRYFLITNVKGTAHPDTGSIDRVEALLSANIEIQATCLWRDDLDRRVERSDSLKWSYPEIITGQDVFRLFVLEKQEGRANAIRAYMSEQFSEDNEVKFKQVELENRLLGLFVDVPAQPSRARAGEVTPGLYEGVTFVQSTFAHFTAEGDDAAIDDSPAWHLGDRYFGADGFPAAALLSGASYNRVTQRVVLEGAPGQGKSTISQFLCQIHRMRLLNEEGALAEVPAPYKETSLRVPFRVDLRDLATWIGGQNPFVRTDSPSRTVVGSRTLETFLATQVHHVSGGHDFTVGDLASLVKSSNILIVLDGFDEIPEPTRRQEVVVEIDRAVRRLESLAISLQVLVTSRPAAFANSPGFPLRR